MTSLVLLHPFPQTSAAWAEVADRLADHFTVLAPDLPGFGKAPLAPGWTVDSAADQIATTLTAAGHDRAIVAGCSMGGTVALAFARRHPSRLAGLILANTRAEADGPEALASREVNLQLVADRGTAALVEKMLPRLLGVTTRTARPELIERVRALGSAQSPEAVTAGLIALRDRPDAAADLPNIAVPTLVIAGAEDELIPGEVSASLAQTIPNASLVTIPHCGHLSPIEAPEAVASAIRERFAAE